MICPSCDTILPTGQRVCPCGHDWDADECLCEYCREGDTADLESSVKEEEA
jgi:hypothetical protein